MTEEVRKAKERSPNFPYISLEQALERAKQFYEMEKRGSAPFTVAAEHWRYSPSSSGAMQTVAALKSYGLMSDEGSGPSRKLRLTDLALRILLDVRPDSKERDAFKRQAALMPPVVAEIYQKWNGLLPSDANLNHYLVLERGFNSVTAAKAVDILKQNETLTLGARFDELSAKLETDDDKLKELALSTQANQATLPPSLQAGASAISGQGVVIRNERMVFSQEIEPQHSLKLFVTGPVDDALLQALNDYVEFQRNRLKPTPKAEKVESGAPAEGATDS